MYITNKTYDRLKFLALEVVPLVTFITALINIWGIPYGKQIIASLTALEAFVAGTVVVLKKVYDKKASSQMGVYGDGDGGDVYE